MPSSNGEWENKWTSCCNKSQIGETILALVVPCLFDCVVAEGIGIKYTPLYFLSEQ